MNERKEELHIDDKPTACEKCGGELKYISHGEYSCYECGWITRDDFGKIRHYIEENGPSTAVEIAENTDVPVYKINDYLRQGRIEIPEGSGIYITCQKCGTDIRYGRYCPACAASLSKSIQGMMEAGAVPKNRKSSSAMHYFGKNNKY